MSDNEKELPLDQPSGWTKYISISVFCFLIAFGGFVFGFDTGTISGFVNMDNFVLRFGSHRNGVMHLSDVRTGLIVSIFNIGCAVGGIFLGKIGDMYGRRIGIMSSMVVYVIGIVLQISASHWVQFFIGRLVTGLAVGIVSVIAPIFISEVSPKQLRGTLVYCFQLCITLGIFLGYCTTYGTKKYTDTRLWRIPLGLCFAWAILLVSGMLCMPELPRYLVEKGKFIEAAESIAKSNKVSSDDVIVHEEVNVIQAGIEKERAAGSASWMELITGKPKIFRRVLLGVALQLFSQLSGVNYFFYYGTTIFQAVGMSDSFMTSIILGVVNFAATFVGIWAIERFGRRTCLLAGSIGMFVCFVIYSLLGSQHLYINGPDDKENTRKPTGKAMIFVTCLYIACYALTWAGGIYCIVSELYPLRIRAKAMSVAISANWIWGFLISFFTPFITSAIHFYYGFVFTGCLLASFFVVYFFVKETKGLSLEEVDELYSSDVQPWKLAQWRPAESDLMKPIGEHIV